MIQKSTKQRIVVDKRLDEKLHQTKMVVSAGTYVLEQLTEPISLAVESPIVSIDNTLFVGESEKMKVAWRRQKLREQLSFKAEKAEKVLRRLPPLSFSTPFFSHLFEKRQIVPFSNLNQTQQRYFRLRLANEESPCNNHSQTFSKDCDEKFLCPNFCRHCVPCKYLQCPTAVTCFAAEIIG